jgi:hypothetical protein
MNDMTFFTCGFSLTVTFFFFHQPAVGSTGVLWRRLDHVEYAIMANAKQSGRGACASDSIHKESRPVCAGAVAADDETLFTFPQSATWWSQRGSWTRPAASKLSDEYNAYCMVQT